MRRLKRWRVGCFTHYDIARDQMACYLCLGWWFYYRPLTTRIHRMRGYVYPSLP